MYGMIMIYIALPLPPPPSLSHDKRKKSFIDTFSTPLACSFSLSYAQYIPVRHMLGATLQVSLLSLDHHTIICLSSLGHHTTNRMPFLSHSYSQRIPRVHGGLAQDTVEKGLVLGLPSRIVGNTGPSSIQGPADLRDHDIPLVG